MSNCGVTENFVSVAVMRIDFTLDDIKNCDDRIFAGIRRHFFSNDQKTLFLVLAVTLAAILFVVVGMQLALLFVCTVLGCILLMMSSLTLSLLSITIMLLLLLIWNRF